MFDFFGIKSRKETKEMLEKTKKSIEESEKVIKEAEKTQIMMEEMIKDVDEIIEKSH